jgi:peptide/nickel transport system substrate-binding protein
MHGFKRWVAGPAVVAAVGITAAVTAVSGSAGTHTVRSSAACTQHGTLTYAIPGAGIDQLDPNTASFAGQLVLQTAMYNALTKYAPDGSLQPDLATSWKPSKDLKTWTFDLRSGVKYADGRPFTAADVVANVERVLDPKVASGARVEIEEVASVKALGDTQVQFKLKSPNALLPIALADVKMSDTQNIAGLNTTGNGTGPYMVRNFVPDQSLALVPNPNYFGSTPCLSEIDIVREPDPTSMVTDFTSGKLSIMWQVPPTSVPKVQSDQNAYLVKPKSIAGAHQMELDTTSPPFNNLLARQALEYALDRKAMTNAAFLGTGISSPGDDIISTLSSAYNKKLKPYTFNLAKAKKLFTEAGVKPGTTFTFWALADRRDEWITIGQILQQDLKKIGLNLKIVRSDVSTWLGKFYPPGKKFPNVIVMTYNSYPPDPSYAFKLVQYGGCDCNWKSPELESLATQALATADPAKRQAIYDRMQVVFAQGAPIAVIAHQTQIIAAQKNVAGLWEDPAGNAHLEDVYLTN